MGINYSVLKNEEKAVYGLRSLYKKFGYSQYKMSKFEEYDLYVRNKDFLVSDNVITFTDTNGKLMALKPDVTLSIIKNTDDTLDSVRKVYYNENVYRVSKGTHSFREIMQVGLECIGNIDDYCIYEVLMLAAESLGSISEDYVLDISHMGIISGVIGNLGISAEAESELIKCIGEKNIHGIEEICTREGVQTERVAVLKELISTYGRIDEVIPKLSKLAGDECGEAVQQLVNITKALDGCDFADKLRIDFSVINDMNYYSGIVFRGFINGIPTGILSGGRYDKLMKKMGRKSGAVGFAVYLDMLERLTQDENEYDVDAVILYDDGCDIEALRDAVSLFTGNGKSVMAQKAVPEKIKYRQLLKLQERGVEIIENNA